MEAILRECIEFISQDRKDPDLLPGFLLSQE